MLDMKSLLEFGKSLQEGIALCRGHERHVMLLLPSLKLIGLFLPFRLFGLLYLSSLANILLLSLLLSSLFVFAKIYNVLTQVGPHLLFLFIPCICRRSRYFSDCKYLLNFLFFLFLLPFSQITRLT